MILNAKSFVEDIMSRITDMTKGSPVKLILGFSLPLILTNIGQQLYMIVDAAIVGRGVGVKALASVGAADWIYWLILWSVIGLTQGFSTFVGRYFGEGDYRKMSKTIATSVTLCFSLGILFTAIGLLIAKPLLVLLDTPADIIGGATTYLYTMIAGTLVVSAYNMAAAILRAFGDSKSPLAAMLVAAFVNIGLDLLFVFVFKWGVFGAAFASVLAQLVSFLYCLLQLSKIPYISIQKSDWKPDFKTMKRLLVLGVPLSAQYVLISASGIVLQSTINTQGSYFVAGYTATNKLYGLLECSAISLGHATATFVSQNFGAGDKTRVKDGVKQAVIMSIVMSVIVSVIMLLSAKWLLALFIDAAEAGGLEAMQVGYLYLVWMLLFLLVLYPIHVYRNGLLAIGNSYWAMISGVAECAARGIMAKVVISAVGIYGLYLTEPASWLAALLFIIFPYYYFQKKLLAEDK